MDVAGGEAGVARRAETDAGHDAFLLDEPEFFRILSGFLAGAAELHGLNGNGGAAG